MGRKPTTKLTKTQKRILNAIRGFIKENEMPPTVREIGDIFGIKSSTVFAHLKSLERKGVIVRTPGKSRGIQFPDQAHKHRKPRLKGIPLLGEVPAGPLDLAFEEHGEYVDVDTRMFGQGDMFALRIKGDSMIEAGILNGDTVIVNRCADADDGQIVVALVEEEATVKEIHRSGGAVLLKPANRNMTPMFFSPGDPVPQILGRVIGVLRRL
jgi:repressor LexA